MSLLNKLAFWKKEDEFDFDKEFSAETSDPKTPAKDLFAEPHEPVQESAFSSRAPENLGLPSASFLQRQSPEARTVDNELINSKLDTIKAQISAIEQRLANIERLLGSEQKQRLW